MSTFRIISLDPGGETGWATFTGDRILPITPGEKVQYENEQWQCGTFTNPEHHLELYLWLQEQQVETTHIVCESFEYRNVNKPGLELTSREHIGVTKLFCQQWQVMLYLQTASMGKITDRSFTKKIHLQRLGFWQAGEEHKHEMDAYGHLLWYMIHHGRVLREELLERAWHEYEAH